MSKPLRVGIVGLGRIFDLNGLGYIGHPEVEVVGLCDVREDTVASRQALFPGARGVTRYEDLLGLDLDLVDILSPHPLHEQMAVAALEAGAHVSVQKPMAMTTGECDAMIAAATRTGKRLKVFENFVFYPPLVKARELLLSGAIGAPRHFRMKVVIGDRSGAWHVPPETNAWRHDIAAKGRGGPLVFDHGHHMMAVALWLFGDVRDCFAQIEETPMPAGYATDAPSTLVWRHREPAIHGMWDVSLALQMKVRTDYYASHEQFEIQGERGLITVNRCSDRLLDEPVLTLYCDGEVRAWHNIEDDWGESFRRSTLHFIDVLKGRADQQILTGEEGRRVVELFDMFDRSSREARRVTHPDLER
ncbi:Gfo/Idh/MocA family oxidoreductase [Vineibacter terrae]|uniref:Gfo/Idh/MocA family oxidoreductase n=1 Tax=Vineibacter terrae TaxID=2586908 RepID=A0A5C8PAS8_9HYPH|nr:Gfo/Idh/MocA family oxidoreductase [Vineibacter terrae]TXL70909.1 Gfo/Idh/MocA family oxidoreductase [Vineibacter terrae]